MAEYRLYFLAEAGHIRGAVDLECNDDGEAIRRAEGHSDGRAKELWRGPHRVTTLPARSSAPG